MTELLQVPYREKIIAQFEGDFDTKLSPYLKWGVDDLYFVHENYMYYSKHRLLSVISEELTLQLQDRDDSEQQEYLNAVYNHLGHDPYIIKGIEELQFLFHNNIPGMPPLVKETKNFFICNDIVCEPIDHTNIDEEVIALCKGTFFDDYNPLLNDMGEGLFKRKRRMYFTNVLFYEYNPNGKLGMFLCESKDNIAHFFAFDDLELDDETLVDNVLKLEGWELGD